jgi:UDP-3-O-[3-hydroxymyristoyl] glucosamine N-acyltransferase
MKYKIPESITAGFLELPFTGNKDYKVNYISSLDAADIDSIIFYSRNDASFLRNIEAGIIIADIKLKDEITDQKSKAIVYSEKPKHVFLALLEKFFNNTFEGGTVAFSNLKSLRISDKSYIESQVSIGEGSEVYPHVAIYNPTIIGKNCRIQSNSVLGGIGLGDLWHNNRYNNFVHLGAVNIEDDVTIGTNVNISRGMLEDTIIGAGTRIANNVSVGHSVIIGKNCYISSGVTIGGACVIEDNCWLAIGVTLIDHIKVGRNTMIGTGGVLIKDALQDSLYLGNPARRVSERK